MSTVITGSSMPSNLLPIWGGQLFQQDVCCCVFSKSTGHPASGMHKHLLVLLQKAQFPCGPVIPLVLLAVILLLFLKTHPHTRVHTHTIGLHGNTAFRWAFEDVNYCTPPPIS